MSHFYGTLKGIRGEATRCGRKEKGMETYCASWAGAVKCIAYVNKKGQDCVIVSKVKWHGNGEDRILYNGLIGEEVKTNGKH